MSNWRRGFGQVSRIRRFSGGGGGGVNLLKSRCVSVCVCVCVSVWVCACVCISVGVGCVLFVVQLLFHATSREPSVWGSGLLGSGLLGSGLLGPISTVWRGRCRCFFPPSGCFLLLFLTFIYLGQSSNGWGPAKDENDPSFFFFF